jgi:hypothetical protein
VALCRSSSGYDIECALLTKARSFNSFLLRVSRCSCSKGRASFIVNTLRADRDIPARPLRRLSDGDSSGTLLRFGGLSARADSMMQARDKKERSEGMVCEV